MSIWEKPVVDNSGELAKHPKKELEPMDEKTEKEQMRKRIVVLARELIESGESFPFPGINPYSYQNLKRDEEDFPGYTTHIDELVERLKQEGMKVVFGTDPESGNVFILPCGSDDIERDSIFPKHLQDSDGMNEKLRELMLLNRN